MFRNLTKKGGPKSSISGGPSSIGMAFRTPIRQENTIVSPYPYENNMIQMSQQIPQPFLPTVPLPPMCATQTQNIDQTNFLKFVNDTMGVVKTTLESSLENALPDIEKILDAEIAKIAEKIKIMHDQISLKKLFEKINDIRKKIAYDNKVIENKLKQIKRSLYKILWKDNEKLDTIAEICTKTQKIDHEISEAGWKIIEKMANTQFRMKKSKSTKDLINSKISNISEKVVEKVNEERNKQKKIADNHIVKLSINK